MTRLTAQRKMRSLHAQEDYIEVFVPKDSWKRNPAYAGALIHLFLPKRTPGQLQANLEEIDEFLLQRFIDSVQDVFAEVPFPSLESAAVMLEKWKSVQPKASNFLLFLEKFQTEMTNLQKGDMIPIYVRNQNSTLLIKKSNDDDDENNTVVLSTFRCSLPSKVVMSTVGDLLMEFPETMETIQNVGMLASKAFAKQLYDISVTPMDITLKKILKRDSAFIDTREVADPKLVSDWIVGLLVPIRTQATQHLERHQFSKKVRDHVSLEGKSGSSRSLPFRRSGMYMALKVALQLKLWEHHRSKEESKLVYKIIMLRLLADVVTGFHVTNSFSMDLACQMLAKLGSRVEKLRNLLDPSPSSPVAAEIKLMKSKCLDYVNAIVERISKQMRELWNQVISGEPKSREAAKVLAFLPNEDDLLHNVPKLDRFLESLKTSFTLSSTENWNDVVVERQVLARYTSTSSILYGGKLLDKNNHVWLHDTEKFIKFSCTEKNIGVSEISRLVMLYYSRAKSYFKNDPLGKSQIFLVALKGMEILDRIATGLYPLLKAYKPEVDMDVFDHLLLPFQKDMKLLDDMLDYFRNRHQNAIFPGILSTGKINANTFSVRFSEQDPAMQNLQRRILEDTEMAIQDKYKEIATIGKKCRDLKRRIMELEREGGCKCEWKTVREKRRGNWHDERCRTIECSKCKLEKQLERDRESVFRYERPLPLPSKKTILIRWAVVFELLIPEQFVIFRNFLAYFKFNIFGEVFKGERKCNGKLWLEYGILSPYNAAGTSDFTIIQLGSPTLPTSSTHHAKSPLDVLNNNPEDYIIENEMNCAFYYTKKTAQVTACPATECTFRLSATSEGQPYFNLQDTLASTKHTQNSIVARQSECDRDLSLQEFVAFGSLRAGHRIQLRNLYTAIFSASLSLEQEPVLALILQTIWQMGPVNESTGERESHLAFVKEDQFALEFLEMLDKLVKTNQANYSNSLILIGAVTITRRIAELNSSLQDKCYTLLKSWRRIMRNWMTKIESVLDEPETAAVYGGVSSVRKNLLEIVTCSMLSYSVHTKSDISTVLRDQDDVVHWFESLYQWHQLQDQPVETSDFFKTLQDFVKVIPLRLELEQQIIARVPLFVDSLKHFICKRWNKADECTFKSVEAPYKSQDKGGLVLAVYLETVEETGEQITHRITFDLIQGIFLFNGFSQSTLPVEIKEHKLFKRYFKDGTNLRIQRDNKSVTRTITPFHGRHYEFYHSTTGGKTEMDDVLIIREMPDEGTCTIKLVLLDPTMLSHCVSNYFIDNFTHWLDITNDLVYFRRINANPLNHSFEYTLQRIRNSSGSAQNSTWKLFDELSRQFVLSILSNGFKQVTAPLRVHTAQSRMMKTTSFYEAPPNFHCQLSTCPQLVQTRRMPP